MKRLIDIVAASVGGVLLLPILVAVAVLVAIRLGRPVFFVQERAGLGERPFRMVKFRTMTAACGADGKLLPDNQRLTRFGRILRATSLDELPELWNVLKGDMSLVGPRPLLMSYLPRYSRDQARRHEVRPGLTGLAQIAGRNSLDWDSKLALDVEYVDTHSLRMDLAILAKTVAIVLGRSGVDASQTETMPEFRGSPMEERREHQRGTPPSE